MADMRSYNQRTGGYQGYSNRGFDSPSRTMSHGTATTPYTAGDEYSDGTALAFGTCAVNNGGGGHLTHAVAVSNVNQSTKPNRRLYLFSGSPPMAGDNLPWAPAAATLGSVVAMAAFDTWEIGGTGSGTAGNCFSFGTINQDYRCAAADTNLYGVQVERGAYTPLSGETLTITLYGRHD